MRQNFREKSLWSIFRSYYRPQLHLFVADTFCALTMALIDLSFPLILRGLANGLFSQGSKVIMDSLLFIAIGLVVMYAVRYLCRFFVGAWGHIMGARMEAAMRQDIFNQYERFSFSYFDRHNTGDLMSRVVADLFDVAEAAHHGPENVIVCSVEIVGSFVLLAFINWRLTLVLAVIAALLVAYNVRINRSMKSIFSETKTRISHVNSQLADSLAGARVVKSFANEEIESKKFSTSNVAYLNSKALMYRALGNYQATISGLTGMLYTVVVIMGGWLIAQGEMLPADLAIYILYIALFMTPIETLLNFTETFQAAAAGFRRFNEILSTKPDILDAPDAKELVVTHGRVRYEHVTFSYDDHVVLHDVNFQLDPGKTVALVGPSGGGKTTLCSLLARFYDVDKGAISIDGQDVRSVTQHSLRRAVGIVQQDLYLFNGTIGENIAYGRPSATLSEIREAAVLANIADFIDQLPEGFDTYVGERGTRLSGGQKQRIAIARIFLKDPAILVLDEATSALDNESEQAVQESLARLAKGRTTLIIAHRLSTIKGADEIITVEQGKISERGTHDELLKRGGTYACYYRMQFEDKFSC